MNEMHHARNDITSANWVFFGEFETPVDQNMNQQINTWLVKTLRPLNLKADFLEKVIASAQKAAEGGANRDSGTGQLWIRVYATGASPSAGQTWGFFHTEKKDGQLANDSFQLAVTFYLYLEGR